MNHKTILKWSTTLFAMALSTVCQAETMPGAYDSWKSCKVGTTVVLECRDSDHPEKSDHQTVTLVKVADEGVTVEDKLGDNSTPYQRFVRPDDKTAASTTQPAKPADVGSATRPAPEEGDEVMEVAGRKIRAHWVKDRRSEDLTYITWTSKDVPGMIVGMKNIEVRAGQSTREKTWMVTEIKVP